MACEHDVPADPEHPEAEEYVPCGEPDTHDHPDPEIDMRLCDLHAVMYGRMLDEGFDTEMREHEED